MCDVLLHVTTLSLNVSSQRERECCKNIEQKMKWTPSIVSIEIVSLKYTNSGSQQGCGCRIFPVDCCMRACALVSVALYGL